MNTEQMKVFLHILRLYVKFTELFCSAEQLQINEIKIEQKT